MQTSERFAAARQVHEVAREYQTKGYEVIVEPKSTQLPQALARFRPDVVARKADEVVVVEAQDHPGGAESRADRGLEDPVVVGGAGDDGGHGPRLPDRRDYFDASLRRRPHLRPDRESR